MKKLRYAVPVVPGPDGATRAVMPACTACGDRSPNSARQQSGVITLCLDTAACCGRYRSGVSAETYAAGLRGELLAVGL